MIVLLIAAGILAAQSSPASGRPLDNPYLAITILPGWTVGPSVDQKLHLIEGRYLLTINPVFTHASGVEGGRFSEIVEGMPSLDAVTANVDQPAGGGECTLDRSDALKVTETISLGNLYTDSSKTGNGCVFPASGPPAWFGSFSRGDGPESEYTITLSYNSADVNGLPRKGSPELKQVFAEVVATLKTLRLKPPIISFESISGIGSTRSDRHNSREWIQPIQLQGDRQFCFRHGGSQRRRGRGRKVADLRSSHFDPDRQLPGRAHIDRRILSPHPARSRGCQRLSSEERRFLEFLRNSDPSGYLRAIDQRRRGHRASHTL